MVPKFSAYPWEALPQRTAREAQLESAAARWIAARRLKGALAQLVGGTVQINTAKAGSADPNAAACEVRIGGRALWVRGGALAVRRIAQQLLGGPPELAGPRPLGYVEQAVWALVVATALDDAGVPAEVWPCPDLVDMVPRETIELAAQLGEISLTVWIALPCGVSLAVPDQPCAAWTDRVALDVPIVVGRCAIERAAIDGLAVRDAITLERPAGDAELAIGRAGVGLAVASGAVVGEVRTGYVRRDMHLPDGCIELEVMLGSTQLTIRRLAELTVGQIVQLGRPLAGPFEIRVAGKRVGQGELIQVDGELGVRILSLEE
jgi:type III secretion protein Q